MNIRDQQPIGVCTLLFNPQGQVLLGKRLNSYKAGYYGLPGGHIELNEPIFAAIKREIAEETGLTIKNLNYLGVVRENQADYDFIHFVYVGTNVTQVPQLREPEKCEKWEWLDINSTNESVLPGHRAAITLFQKNTRLIDLTH